MLPLRNFISDTIDSVRPDSLSRLYNNLWGSYSNTHMRRLPDGTYEITGHAIAYTGYMAGLLTCRNVPQSQLINLPKSWNDILVSNNMSAWFDKDESGFGIIRIAPHNPEVPECHPGLCIPPDTDIMCSSDLVNGPVPYVTPED